MDEIRQRMMDVYGYDTGPYEDYIHETNNEKILAKIDWNINDNHSMVFRYNRLDARRDLPPHPFVLSFNASGRGPNENSLPFRNAGYRINNRVNSFVVELNSRGQTFSNRAYVSYNRFRDRRDAFSADFPTVEIGENGITYTTLGHEPFSIHNILDSDIWQFTDNFSYYTGKHVLTFGANFETFTFFNSFNIFRHGVFFLPPIDIGGVPLGSTFGSLNDFFAAVDTSINFQGMVTPSSTPFKGEDIKTGQFAIYAQDEFSVTDKFNLIYGLRVDFPIYFTEPVDNPFSRGLQLKDADGNDESIDQSKLPDVRPLWSPRVGFNWDVTGRRTTQLRGGTGIFTGRLPFVWIGNVISNPGPNPNLPPSVPVSDDLRTSDDATLQQSFDLNAMVDDFKWPQVWTTNLAVDQRFGNSGWIGTLEFVYGKDINAIFVRNADLVTPVESIPTDERNFYGGFGQNKLNPSVIVDGETIEFGGGAYVLDNSNEGWNYNITAQLRKTWNFGLSAMAGYSHLQARNQFKSTEIASVLWAESPVQSNPNNPELSFSEFGLRNRFMGAGNYRHKWSNNIATSFGFFAEVAEGNRFAGAGGNRYSFLYAGDVNGDGVSNDLIYIPRSQDEIALEDITEGGQVVKSADQQWQELNAFIEQDPYLSSHRGQIAERFGLVNEWWWNIDLRILQDFSFDMGTNRHTFQISLDFLNLPNLLNSSWGVRKVANSAAVSPLLHVTEGGVPQYTPDGDPILNFTGPPETFIDDPGLNSRWQIQLGLRYLFN
jgi:hypothetical protein